MALFQSMGQPKFHGLSFILLVHVQFELGSHNLVPYKVDDKLAGLAVLGGLYPQIETNPRRNIDSIVDICHDIIISHDLL